METVRYTVVNDKGWPMAWYGSSSDLGFYPGFMPIVVYDMKQAEALLEKGKAINPSAKIITHGGA